ncbi:MAG: hypothetical protein ABJC13_01880 [Acidobacteriota bacterium]
MRSPLLCSIALLLGLTSFAFAFADQPAKTLPLAQNGIALLAQPQDDGWDVRFLLAHVLDGTRIRYRRLGADDWKELLAANDLAGPLDLGTIGTGEQVVEVELFDPEKEKVTAGPFRLSFDPEKERIRQVRYLLEQAVPSGWVAFNESTEEQIYAYFGTVWSRKEALRSIRYSLDDCNLDSTPVAPGYFPITSRFTYLCMQLVYADGVVTPPRIFFQHRPAATEHPRRPPAPDTLPVAPVRLESERSNSGWSLSFQAEDEDSVAEYRYRLETDSEWRSGGELPWTNPATGRRAGNPKIALDPLRVMFGPQRIEVELVGWDGVVSRPYALWFDPDAEVLSIAKTTFADSDQEWGIFGDGDDQDFFYFAVFGVRDALREIRYSVDDCAVGKRFEFPPWNDVADSPPEPDVTSIRLPKATAFVCVQLVLTDGTVTEIRKFNHATEEEEEFVAPGEEGPPVHGVSKTLRRP